MNERTKITKSLVETWLYNNGHSKIYDNNAFWNGLWRSIEEQDGIIDSEIEEAYEAEKSLP